MDKTKRTIKLQFAGFGKGRPIEDSLIYKIIARNYNICQKGNPDYILVHGSSPEELWRCDDCITILLDGENYVADFNDYDYAFGYDNIKFGDRYLRTLVFLLSPSFRMLVERKSTLSDEALLNRKFCSFVVSNMNFGDPIRRKFFERLSKYKRVDSGGRWGNNVGGAVKDKLAFCRGYKFNIAFENSAYPGYTTEKVMEAYAAESIPIYFGNPDIAEDFRLESMVRVKDESDIDRAIEEVIGLDRDDAAYLAKCRERCFTVQDPNVYERELESFLCHIFDQPLESARRRCRYGCQQVMRDHLRKLMAVDRWIGKARKLIHV